MRPLFSQPQTPTGLNRSNRLLSELRFLYVPSLGPVDLIKGRKGSYLGTTYPATVGAQGGKSVYFNNQTGIYFPRDPLVETPVASWAVLGQLNNAVTGQALFLKTYNNNTSEPYLSYGFQASTTAANYQIGTTIGSAGAFHTVPSKFLSTQYVPFLLVGTYDGLTLRYYGNGKLVSTLAYTGTLEYDATATGNLVVGTSSSAATPKNPLTGRIYQAAMWARVLSAAEIRAYTTNPWQLFASPKHRRTYSLPSGGTVYSESFTESGSGADLLTSLGIFPNAYSDAGAAADAASAAAVFPNTYSDAGAAADAASAAAVFPNTYSDAGAAADAASAAAVFPNTYSDAGAAADAASATSVYNISITDTGAATDYVSNGSLYADSLGEAGAASDALVATVVFNNTLLESGSLQDVLATAAQFNASLLDSGVASELVGGIGTFTVPLQESASAADFLSNGSLYSETLTEAGAASDSLLVVAVFQGGLTETGVALDSTGGTATYSDLASESGLAADTLSCVGIYAVALTESGIAIDAIIGNFAATLPAFDALLLQEQGASFGYTTNPGIAYVSGSTTDVPTLGISARFTINSTTPKAT